MSRTSPRTTAAFCKSALPGSRTNAVTLCPRASACPTMRRPTPPAAPSTRMFMELAARQHADLFQHAHEVVEEVFFHNLALLVPVRYRAEVDVEFLVRRSNNGAVGHRHRPFHGAGKIRNCTRPVVLRQHDLVRIVDQVLVGKHSRERDGLLLMRRQAKR